jgi:hypothetical protein
MHPKDREVVRQLFGSAAVPVVERGVAAAQTPTGELTVKAAKVAGAVAALAVLYASIDLRS